MKKDEIKKIISECCNDLIFIYDNKNAIITSTVSNYVPTFEATYNGKSKKYNDVDDVMSDKFYNGKSVSDLSDMGIVTFTCAQAYYLKNTYFNRP